MDCDRRQICFLMGLRETLLELSRRHMAEIPARDRVAVADELDRLRMMRLSEEGLGVGDYLPDFELPDGVGRVHSSADFLDKGPLVVALFRGDWCPYCDLTMAALNQALPAIKTLGASVVGIMPGRREHLIEIVERRKLDYPLLSDPANGYARMCGLAYELSAAHIQVHAERNRDLALLHDDKDWRLPIPAVFVAEPSARIAYAFSDVDPAGWPDPEELLASLAILARPDAAALSNR